MATERQMQITYPVNGFEAYGTHVDDEGMAVKVNIGDPVHGGAFSRYTSVEEARAMAAALVAAADHYDAETARLAAPAEPVPTCEAGAPDCGPVEHYDSEGIPLCKRCYDALPVVMDGAEA